ncbi:hypothetical protein [Priestia endophytica]|uniref:Uncharacterized protein n=1 Tax=Priestia endophytica TaxID=135735 RepID=A0AAX1Q4F1_9BACI|nr:hypothetical protein [Priestia endophytica]RAS72763.1 hypothetical protein A3864_21715 [Priestia endophytica]RAS83147.1 hypothetical protein A4R27_07345 [Priestia endophytica]
MKKALIKALIKALQYLLLATVILVILNFRGDMNITPYIIALVILTIAKFLIHFFIEKKKR